MGSLPRYRVIRNMDPSSYLLHFILLSITLSLIFLIFSRKSAGQKLPPGKMGWPIIGETLEFFLTATRGTPEKFISDRMNKYSREIFKTSLLGEKMAVLCGAPGNKYIFSNHNKLFKIWWPRSLEKALFYQASATKLEPRMERSYLIDFLKPEALQHYIGAMDLVAQKHLEEDWIPNKEVEVFPLSKKYTFALACRLLMSITDPQQIDRIAHPFHLVVTGLVSLPIDFPGTPFSRAIKGGKAVRGELMAIIKERRMKFQEKKEDETEPADLLSTLLVPSAENGKDLSDVQITDKIVGLLLAAYDTTSATMTFMLKHLAENPVVYDQVLKEQMEIAKSKGPGEFLNWNDVQKMKYTWGVACETMRLSPPALGTYREALTDFTYGGYTIPKGWKTHWNVNSTYRDPQYFPDPEKFDPSRFEGKGPAPYSFAPFGGGPRMCPGKEYARLQLLVFMHNVVTRFKWEKVDPNEKIAFTHSPIPMNGFPIRLHPYKKI